jgi:hypothetical protein
VSFDIRLNIERLEDGRWVNPVELESIFSRDAYARFGFADIQVCSFSAKGPQKELLFGPFAVVPMNLRLPDDLCSELQHLKRESEAFCDGWCLLEDMRLDLWQTEFVLMTNRVSTRLAEIFGSGERLASEVRSDIQAYGFPEYKVDRMLNFEAHLTSLPVNWANHRLYELRQLDQSASVPVTWRELYAGCAGTEVSSTYWQLTTLDRIA